MKIVVSLTLSTLVLLTACSSGSSTGDAPSSTAISHGNGFYNSRRSSFDNLGNLTSDRIYEIDTDTNRINRFFTAEDNTVLLRNFGEYNELGYLVRSTSLNDDGSTSSVISYTHNDAGQLTQRDVERFSESDSDSFDVYSYNDQSQILSVTSVDTLTNETLFTRAYTYNDESQLESRLSTLYDAGSVSSVVRYTYFYSPQGQFIAREEDADDDGIIEVRREYQYDMNNNLVQVDYFDSAGNNTSIDTFEWEAVNEPVYNLWIRRFLFFP